MNALPAGPRYKIEEIFDPAGEFEILLLWECQPTRIRLMSAIYDYDFEELKFVHDRDDVPCGIEAWFREEVRRRLPPMNGSEPNS